MRSVPIGWNTLFTAVGFKRRTTRKRSRRNCDYRRHLGVEALEDRRMLAILTVNSFADTHINADGVLTLREAVEVVDQGNTNGLDSSTIQNQISGSLNDPNIIRFNLSSGQQILLNRSFGQLNITKSLSIDASTLAAGVVIDADDPSPGSHSATGIRVFAITSSGITPSTVTMSRLVLTGADALGDGGAIFSAGLLTLIECTITGNSADRGGGVFVEVAGGGATARNVLTLEECVIEDNQAYNGGGVVVVAGSLGTPVSDVISIVDTQFIENSTTTSSGNGGGLLATLFGVSSTDRASVSIVGSTFSGNEAFNGGGISVEMTAAEVMIDNSTFSNHNKAGGFGGGIQMGMSSNSAVTITHSSFTDNEASVVTDGPRNGGGGIYVGVSELASNVTFDISDSRITGNSAAKGGGIKADMPVTYRHGHTNDAILSVRRSVLEDNEAAAIGGALYAKVGSGSQATVEDSVITGNTAGLSLPIAYARIQNSGGGVYAYLFSDEAAATLTISGTEISNNVAGQHGGGVAVFTKREHDESAISRLDVFNSTISGNVAGHTTMANDPGKGGGLYLSIFDLLYGGEEEALDAHLRNATITRNTADVGAGVWSLLAESTATRNNVRLSNSIASDNSKHDSSPSNLFGSFNIAETIFNIIGSDNDPTNSVINNTSSHSSHALAELSSQNIFNDDPMLGNLSDNGGLTRTHAPLFGSPAIDAGSNALADEPFTNDPLTTDQRGEGFPRIHDVPNVGNSDTGATGFAVDIGAHEVGLARVVDVLLHNPAWVREQYSFAELVPLGKQLTPIAAHNVTVVSIKFSEDVRRRLTGGTFGALDGSEMQLKQSVRNTNGTPGNKTFQASEYDFDYDDASGTATWTFNAPLADGKYAIHLLTAGVGGLTGGGFDLDGDWTNDKLTPDNLMDQELRPFVMGDGMAGSVANEFRFHFAVLAADFSGNGAVGGEDFIIWDNHYGETGVVPGDANGDAVVDDDDFDIWEEAFAAYLPLWGVTSPDLIDDEFVGNADFVRWKNGFGTSGEGDINGDGNTDGVDFLLWQASFGPGVWYVQPAMIAAALVGDAAPQVVNVIISGSLSIHTPFSFDTVDGSGSQVVTVPVGGADTVSIVFSEGVNVSADCLRVVGLRFASTPQVVDFHYEAGSFTATWRLEGWRLYGDQYLISVADRVTDEQGNPLDGEWVNPRSTFTTNSAVSNFPSGNGRARQHERHDVVRGRHRGRWNRERLRLRQVHVSVRAGAERGRLTGAYNRVTSHNGIAAAVCVAA
jgi:hypothetical protein